MKVLKTKTLRGPNVWSIRRHQLIEMLVDLEELEAYPTNKIPGFYERLQTMLPGLYQHRCSEGVPGGFFRRIKEGTWMGHVMEHIALELQSLADMNTGFGRTRSADRTGVYHVVYSYLDAEAGIYAGNAAVRICNALVKGEEYDLNPDIQKLTELWNTNKFGPSTQSIIQEALDRNIPVLRLNSDSYVQLGYGKYQQRIEASIAATTGCIAVEIAGDKHMTKEILAQACIPVPRGEVISDISELEDAAINIGFPLAIKPLDGNHGRGITTNINSLADASLAFHKAKQISEKIICESYITGHDYRVLVINNKFIAAALRTPACIIGDGRSTIQELIDKTNAHPLRGMNHDNVLTCISIDDTTLNMLAKSGYQLSDIPGLGTQIYLKDTANLSSGGTAEDVTDKVHPANVCLFERAARTIGLNICGIDVVSKDLSVPLRQNGGAILEINAAPGLRMHLQPSSGTPRNVAKPIIDMLFPGNARSRIPIIAVTGTNGKTTTTRLIAHIMKNTGLLTAYTTTDGIYIGDELVEKGDCSGPTSAQVILRDSSVECAVLESARGGILRSGLGFDSCDVGIVTNIAEDHLGMQGINTLEQLAKVKSVVAETVCKTGTAILNADDDLSYGIRENVDCQVALFSLQADNERIEKHCSRGGIAAIYKDDSIYLLNGRQSIRVDQVQNIPCTFDGKAEFNIANALAAVLACAAQNVSVYMIRHGLRTFQMSAEATPGRMNVFEFGESKVLLDYAHNPHGLRAMGNFIKKMNSGKRVGIVAGVGDRRDDDIIKLGEESAKIFDEIILRQDSDTRGRSGEEIHQLITTGIRKVDVSKPLCYFQNEPESIQYALDHMQPGSLVVILADDIWAAIEQVKERLNRVMGMQRMPVAV